MKSEQLFNESNLLLVTILMALKNPTDLVEVIITYELGAEIYNILHAC